MRNMVPSSSALVGITINGETYYVHGFWDDISQTYIHCVLSEYVVEKSQYRKYLLKVCESHEECKNWVYARK